LATDNRPCGHDYKIDGPFNTVIASGHVNDPACEAEKALQNQVYLRALDVCNAGYLASNGKCEAEKGAQNTIYAAQKAACEADKVRLQEIETLAHVGHISGDFSASGVARADVHSVGASEGLDSVSMQFSLAGEADVLAHVKFDPDTAGRLACTFGWDKDLRTRASIPQQSLKIIGVIEPDPSGGILVRLQSVPVSLRLDPPPVQAIFAAHPELVVNCLALVQNVVVPGLAFRALQQGDIPSEISGKYDVELPAATFVMPLQVFHIAAGSQDIVLHSKFDSNAVWFIGQ
jgi:hypothetical protein